MHNVVSLCGNIEQKLCAALRIINRFLHTNLSSITYTPILRLYTQTNTLLHPHTYPHKKPISPSVSVGFYPLYTGLIITTTNKLYR